MNYRFSLSPLLLLLIINEIVDNISVTIKLFADKRMLYAKGIVQKSKCNYHDLGSRES